MDIVNKERRSRMMSGIRSQNTMPELLIRKGLFKLGFRYRINSKMFGKPDIVLKKYNAVIFIHGCFWHGHIGCENFKIPKSNTAFWLIKLIKIEKEMEKFLIIFMQLIGEFVLFGNVQLEENHNCRILIRL